MKKLDLLKIIKEEIDIALSEGIFHLKNDSDALRGLEKQITVTGTPPPEIASKYKKVAEVELEEEQLDEMPKISEPIENAMGIAIKRLRQEKPDITVDQIQKLINNKGTQEKVAPELKAALDKDFEIHGGGEKYTTNLGKDQTIRAIERILNPNQHPNQHPPQNHPHHQVI